MKKRVIALLSGGVDSSVGAALLVKQGYEVIGVYILGWQGEGDFPCNWQKEEADARLVAEKLNIPFFSVNLSREYAQAVIEPFFREYQAGVTPNPDVLCNKEIKFAALWRALRQWEPDYLATGHYSRKKTVKDSSGRRSEAIFKADDLNKDQSYFLWAIEAKMVERVLFPLGKLKKPQVRQLATEFNLPTAVKKDSQGVCFLGQVNVKKFLASRTKVREGGVVMTNGRLIARHRGVPFYTIGERLRAGAFLDGGWEGDAPALYVLAKDLIDNRLIVGLDKETFASELSANQLNWLAKMPRQFVCQAKIRYRQEDVETTVRWSKDRATVSFSQPVRAITAGQSIVFYSSSGQLLGGGVINEVPAQVAMVASLAN